MPERGRKGPAAVLRPRLHDREYLAIDDALNAIRFLEREEERYDENKRRMALETAARKLESIGPKINDVRDKHEIAQKRYRSERHDRNFVRRAFAARRARTSD